MQANEIILHCTASKNGIRYDIIDIDRDHKSRGWDSVGYHLVIQPDGECQRGRSLNVQGAHVKGANRETLGIALVGDTKFTSEQFDTLRYQLDSLIQNFGIDPWAIRFHREYPSAIEQGKTCPNMMPNQILYWYWTGAMDSIKEYLRERSPRE